MEPKLLLYFKTHNAFKRELERGTIDSSRHLCFIDDERLIWCRGKYYADNERLEGLSNQIVTGWEPQEGDVTSDSITLRLSVQTWNPDTRQYETSTVIYTLNSATEDEAGLMSSTDKQKLDRVEYVNHEFSTEKDPDTVTIILDSTNANTGETRTQREVINSVTKTEAGLMTSEDKARLDRVVTANREFASAIPSTIDVTINARSTDIKDGSLVADSVSIPGATETSAGVMTAQQASDLEKLNNYKAFKTISADEGGSISADEAQDTLVVTGKSGITTRVTKEELEDRLTIVHNDITRTNTGSIGTNILKSDGSRTNFTVIDAINTNAQGHVTSVNVRTQSLSHGETDRVDNDVTGSSTIPADGTGVSFKTVEEVRTNDRGHVTGVEYETRTLIHGKTERNDTLSNEEITIPAEGTSGAQFSDISSVSTNEQGHIIGVNSKSTIIKHGDVERTDSRNEGVTVQLGDQFDMTVAVSSNDKGHITGTTNRNITISKVLPDGTTATTQPASDNSNKVATTSFVKSAFAEVDAMTYEGVIAGTATSPGAFTPASNKGNVYKVSTSGYINGVKVKVGDMLICNTDGTVAANSSNYTTIAKNWDIIQTNIEGYVLEDRQIIAGAGLAGGGLLAADRTINVVSADDGIIVNADSIKLNIVNDYTTGSSTRPISAVKVKNLYEELTTKYLPLTAGSSKKLIGDLVFNGANGSSVVWTLDDVSNSGWERGLRFWDGSKTVANIGVCGNTSNGTTTISYAFVSPTGNYSDGLNLKVYPNGNVTTGNHLLAGGSVYAYGKQVVLGDSITTAPYLKPYGSSTSIIAVHGPNESACSILAKSILVSSTYADNTKIPEYGIYSKGAVKSSTGFTSDFRLSDLNIARTGSDVLHISSFAGDNTVVNRPATDPISGQIINDGVALTYFWAGDFAFQLVGDIDGTGMAYRKYTPSTGASTAWKFLADTNWVNTKVGDYVLKSGDTMTGALSLPYLTSTQPQSGWTSSKTPSDYKAMSLYIEDDYQGGSGISSYGTVLTVSGRNSHWVNQIRFTAASSEISIRSCNYAADASTRQFTAWKTLPDKDYISANYLKLSGGTLTGQVIISAALTNPFRINNTNSSGNECFLKVQLQGTDKAAIGFLSGSGSYIHNYESSKYLFVKSDGAYFGTPSSNTRVLTTSDVQILPASYKNDPNSLPINQIFYAETQGVTGTPTANGLILSAQGNDEGMQFWTGSDRTSLYFRTKWTSYGNWIQLADRSYVSGNYLPLTGGTMSGSITIPGNTGQSLIVTANESSNYVNAVVYKKGNTSHAAMMGYHSTGGTIEGTGAIILVPYPTDTNAWAKTVGLYIAKNELLLDGNAVATQSWTTSQGYITSSALSGYATQSWCNSNFASLSRFTATGSYSTIISMGNEMCIGNKNQTTNAADFIVNYRVPTGCTYAPTNFVFRAGSSTSWANIYAGNLYMSNNLVATQSWVNSQGFIKSTPTLSLTTTGSGNAITSISVSGHSITATKGSTFLTSASNYYTTSATFVPAGVTATSGGAGGVHRFTRNDGGAYDLRIRSIGGYYTSGGPEKPSAFNDRGLYLQMLGGSNLGLSSVASYFDALIINSYISDVPNCNALVFPKNGSARGYIVAQNPNNSDWGTKYEIITTGNISSQSVNNAANLGGVAAGNYLQYYGRDITNCNAANAIVQGMHGFSGTPTNGPGGASYLAMMAVRNSDVGFQLAGGYTSDNLYFRGWSSSGSNFYTWRTVIHSGNIGSQSVNYATSAGSATTASKLGSSTVGSASKPIYLSSGTPTACTLSFWSGTQAQYDAISSKDANTIYFVTE